MLRIRKNDKVIILTGKDKGKIGKVLRVMPKLSRVVVEKMNLSKKARRKTQQDQQGGFVELESPIHISNVMLVDKKNNQRTRFGVDTLKDGTRVRTGKKTKESF